MPTCGECGQHWFGPTVQTCPLCGAMTSAGRAHQRSEAQDPRDPALVAQIVSPDDVTRKAALETLSRSQTREAFDAIFAAFRTARDPVRRDLLTALYYFPQYADAIVPQLLAALSTTFEATVIANMGEAGLRYLMGHRTEAPDDALFWEAFAQTAAKVDGGGEFIATTLDSDGIDVRHASALLTLIGKEWFPVARLIEFAARRLDSDSAETRNAAANILFQCGESDRLEPLLRDDVLGIRCRAVQACRPGSAVEKVLCDAANLESVIERGRRAFLRPEQMVERIAQATGQEFAGPADCLDWVRHNCYG